MAGKRVKVKDSEGSSPEGNQELPPALRVAASSELLLAAIGGSAGDMERLIRESLERLEQRLAPYRSEARSISETSNAQPAPVSTGGDEYMAFFEALSSELVQSPFLRIDTPEVHLSYIRARIADAVK